MAVIQFFVPGTPQPGGSKRAFVNPKTGKAIVTDANIKASSWKADVRTYAEKAYSGALLEGPLVVKATFFIKRPSSHYGSGKNAGIVKNSAPSFPTSKPDATKLFRSTEDALTGVIWKDDAQIVLQEIRKQYATVPGVELYISDEFPRITFGRLSAVDTLAMDNA